MDEEVKTQLLISRELLGNKVRDTVTGIRGTVTGVAVYLHAAPNAGVEYVDAQGVARTVWIVQSRLQRIAS